MSLRQTKENNLYCLRNKKSINFQSTKILMSEGFKQFSFHLLNVRYSHWLTFQGAFNYNFPSNINKRAVIAIFLFHFCSSFSVFRCSVSFVHLLACFLLAKPLQTNHYSLPIFSYLYLTVYLFITVTSLKLLP